MKTSAALVLAGCATGSMAQDHPPMGDNGSSATQHLVEPKLADHRPPGWLSDPATPADDFRSALVSGKIHLDNRLRFEAADTTGRNSSSAVTNRLRLGYESKPFMGFSGFVEMESVATPTEDLYFVPATGSGTPDRTVIADPAGTEVNQAYARFHGSWPGESALSMDVRVGRQRIKLDDDRFIGNIGWRQFEQTFDAVSLRSDFGVERLELFYAYAWGVQRIFGPDGPNPDSRLHFINTKYRVTPRLNATAFAYLLDFRDDDPLSSSNTYGLRLDGRIAEGSATSAMYELTYAYQTDAGSNPVDYGASFVAAQFRLDQQDLGHIVTGYQLLGSDGGAFAFRFPLGTNHKFQGFADNFLITPATGLHDAYIGVGGDLPFGVKASVTYHEYWAESGGTDQGEELNAVASKRFNANWSVLLKAAYFDGDSGQPDTTRFWAQTSFRF